MYFTSNNYSIQPSPIIFLNLITKFQSGLHKYNHIVNRISRLFLYTFYITLSKVLLTMAD